MLLFWIAKIIAEEGDFTPDVGLVKLVILLEPDLRTLVARVADKRRFRWLLILWLGYLGRLWGSLGHERVLGRVAELLGGLAARLGPRFELALIDLLDLELCSIDFLGLKVAFLFVCLVSVDNIAVLGCQKLQEL